MKTISNGVIAAAASALIVSSIVIAQSVDEITVQATRNMNVTSNPQNPPGGASVKDISMSYSVNTSGLNLAMHADVVELEKRVKDTALTACKEIGRQYPNSTPSVADCAKAASDKAMVKVNQLVAAASKKSTN
jgi:UrcA family protein